MKLRNKKTGEIREFDCVGCIVKGDIFDDTPGYFGYNSLAELSERWADYKEPTLMLSGKDKDMLKAARWVCAKEPYAIMKTRWTENTDVVLVVNKEDTILLSIRELENCFEGLEYDKHYTLDELGIEK